MTLLIATSPLLKMVYSSLAAGIGIAIVFSLAILGAIRSSDRRRTGRASAAAAYAALAGCGLVLSAAVVIYGLILVGHKS